MESLKSNLHQQVIQIMENKKVSIDLSWLEIEEIITALEQRIVFSKHMKAKADYLTFLQNIISKLTNF
jgi:diaminopimelate decarboxylase